MVNPRPTITIAMTERSGCHKPRGRPMLRSNSMDCFNAYTVLCRGETCRPEDDKAGMSKPMVISADYSSRSGIKKKLNRRASKSTLRTANDGLLIQSVPEDLCNTVSAPISLDGAGQPPRPTPSHRSRSVPKNQGGNISCPDVVFEDPPSSEVASLSNHKSLSYRTPSPQSRASSRLTVPDIFTTSFTHSRDMLDRTRSPVFHNLSHEGRQRSSEPDLANSLQHSSKKKVLTKSLSDSPCLGMRSAELYKVTDYLYIGSLEAVYHQQMLCRAKIESVVDLTNLAPEDVVPQRKNEIPCSCQLATKHYPATLRIRVRETDLVDIRAHFIKINKFIEGARDREKRTMVACLHGDSLSVLAAMQYLMSVHHHGYKSALRLVQQVHSVTPNIAYRELLKSVERQLQTSGITLTEIDSKNVCERAQSTGSLPKSAWT